MTLISRRFVHTMEVKSSISNYLTYHHKSISYYRSDARSDIRSHKTLALKINFKKISLNQLVIRFRIGWLSWIPRMQQTALAIKQMPTASRPVYV